MLKYVKHTLRKSIAVVTINRPNEMNALNSDLLKELYETIETLDENANVKAVILTGINGTAFVSGADIKEMSLMDETAAREFSRLGQKTMNRIASMRPFTIAAINGYCLGAGCELAAVCDMRIASEQSEFGVPAARLGVFPGFGGTYRLPRLIGLANAKELLATAQLIDAAKAKELGLVNYVVESTELISFCMELAAEITKQSAGAIALGKQAMTEGMGMNMEEALELENGLFGKAFSTADKEEGMQAFLEKRTPEFQ